MSPAVLDMEPGKGSLPSLRLSLGFPSSKRPRCSLPWSLSVESPKDVVRSQEQDLNHSRVFCLHVWPGGKESLRRIAT